MTTVMKACIESAAFWAPSLPGWPVARSAFRGEGRSIDPPARRPSPELLPAAERRRAPDTVALALAVADDAVSGSHQPAQELLSVFASCHGDLAITDAICTTLVEHPLLVSPTRFHNSVHNAASGYWGIATGCRAASSAVSAYEQSFAAGLFEALTLCVCEGRPVLLVGCDVAACGAIASTTVSQGLLAVATVLSPERSAHTLATLDAELLHGSSSPIPLRSEAALALAKNAMADALPLYEALARETTAPLALPLSPTLSLRIRLAGFD